MALTVGTNSWVTVTEANDYFLTSYGRSVWASLSNSEKETLLISAYNWIQQQSIFSISATSTDSAVKQGQYETSWYIYSYWNQTEDRRALYAQGVREFKISKFSEKLEPPEFPQHIIDILEDFLINLGGGFSTWDRTLST